jgi:glyoxylase-like metal-dependent hydrolase (beta-lactamase superfamily II)
VLAGPAAHIAAVGGHNLTVYTQVADGVHRLTNGIANFYLIEEAGKLVLVDAGTPKDWALFAKAVQALGHRVENLDAVLLTHAHADHTGFADQARTTVGARVWVHEADEEMARTGKAATSNEAGITSYLLKRQLYKTFWVLARGGATKIIPIRELATFSDGETIDVPGQPRVLHAPGHTAGSAVLLAEGRCALFAGDVLCTHNPLTGRIGPQIMPSGLNRDTQQAMRSLDNLSGVKADVVLAGHGDPWTGGVGEAVRLAQAAGAS